MTLWILLFTSSIPLFLCLIRRYNPLNPKQIRLPPGPEGSLFTGVKNQLSSSPWTTYAKWAEHYDSPVISFWVYNRRTVVLNDYKSIRDLLDKRGNIYSDRPKSWMYHELCDRGKSVFNISSLDSRHSKYRRLLQHGLSGRAVRDYYDLLEDEAENLVESLTKEPRAADMFPVIFSDRNAAAVIMKVAYGYTVTKDDPFIGIAEEAAKISGWALTPGRWFVDYYPIVRFIPSWFPFAGFKRQGEEWKHQLDSLSGVPHKWAKTQMGYETFEPSLTSRLLRPNGATFVNAEEEDIVKWLCSALYAGTSDTTVSAMTSFILLMALYPGVQKQAQAELSDLAGPDQEPSIRDLHKYTYLNAILKEVLRYAPVSNIALPHRVIEDDVYRDYSIPKDSTVIANTWAVLHDPALYPQPFDFNPLRFVDKCPDINPDPKEFAFGYGRRTCPGIQFAEISMILVMSRILSSFDLSLPANSEVPQVEFTSGITSHIKPFEIVIRRRQ